MSRLFAFCLLALLSALSFAGELDGHYQAVLDGVPSELILRSKGQEVDGEYVENGKLRLQLKGQLEGQLLSAAIHDPESGQHLANLNASFANDQLNTRIAARNPATGEVLERDALFQRHSAESPVMPAIKSNRDPALIGTWVHEQIITSASASFASMTTLLVLQLNADGSVSQWRRSQAGGQNWSADTPGELQYSGQWQSRDDLLQVQLHGQSDYQPAARYRFSEQYLVTESNTGQMVWYRR
jgi:hypothetical protein